MLMTKGKMIQVLKKNGIRRGEKDKAIVPLEHLKYPQIATIYYNFVNCGEKQLSVCDFSLRQE